MSNTKEKLKALAHYFLRNRGVGHTATLLDGAANVNGAIIVAQNHKSVLEIEDRRDIPFCYVTSLDESIGAKLAGLRKPLVVDNEALTYLFLSAIEEIERLEEGLIDARMLNGKRVDCFEKESLTPAPESIP